MVSDNERLTAKKQMVGAADSAAGLLENDVKKAVLPVANASENFKVVEAKLTVIDGKNIVSNKLVAKWQPLHSHFSDVLKESKDLASEVAAYAAQIDTGILKIAANKTLPAASRIKIAQSSADKATGFVTLSETLAAKATGLSTKVVDFGEQNLNNFAAAEEGELKKQQATIKSSITAVKSALATINKTIGAVATELSTAELTTGIAGGQIPSFGTFVLIAGTDGVLPSLKSQLEELKNNRESKNRELASLQVNEAQITDSLVHIATARAEIQDVSGRVSQILSGLTELVGFLRYFGSLAAAGKAYCLDIIKHLEAGTGNAEIVEVYLAEDKTLFTPLAEVMRLFVSNVSRPSL